MHVLLGVPGRLPAGLVAVLLLALGHRPPPVPVVEPNDNTREADDAPFTVMRESTLAEWRAITKGGADLPPLRQRRSLP